MADSPKRREPNAPITITNQQGCTAMHLPKDGEESTSINPWHWLDITEGNHWLAEPKHDLPEQPVMVSFGWWLDCRDAPIIERLRGSHKLALGFLPDDDPRLSAELIQEWLAENPEQPLGVYFPNFKDGRGYSIAATLRGRMAYGGELIAFGDILADQASLLARCGFTTLVLRADQQVDTVNRQRLAFSVRYQNDWRQQRSTLAT